MGGLELVCNEAVPYIGEGDCEPTLDQRNQTDDANVGRCTWQVLSSVVVVSRTHREVSIDTSGLHGTKWQTLGDLELACNEAVRSTI